MIIIHQSHQVSLSHVPMLLDILVHLSFTSQMAATYEAEAHHSLASQRSLSNV